jgi:transposase
VSIIGECYTSQRCSQCLRFLKKCFVGGDDIWALKRCDHCTSAAGTDLIWNRDRNVSLNIMRIYLSLARTGLRPAEFGRNRN